MSFSMAALSEVLSPVDRGETPVPGKLYRQIGVRLWGEGAYEREPIDGAATQYPKLFQAKANDVIVNKIWARNGSVAVVPENLDGCYGSNEFPMFAPVQEKLEPRWFNWMTKTKDFWSKCDEKSRGTSGKNRIRPQRFLTIEIPLPSLLEQRRIVTRIEGLMAKIEEMQYLRRQTVQETNALLKTSNQSVLGAPNKKVGEVAEVTKLAGFEYTKYFTNAMPGDVVVIRAGNVRNTGLDLSNAMTITKEVSDALPRSQLKSGDVVMTFIGAKIGDVTSVQSNNPRLHCGPNVAKLTPNEQISDVYLVKVLQSPLIQDQIQEITKSTAQPSLSMKTIRLLRLPVPPIAEQNRIVGHLNKLQISVNSLMGLQAETATELGSLPRSILDKAFKGEL
jgi:type I restriction enzyme S subunit